MTETPEDPCVAEDAMAEHLARKPYRDAIGAYLTDEEPPPTPTTTPLPTDPIEREARYRDWSDGEDEQ
ncbi:hypothetical protein [Planobispora rosea]|uniref:hypothetical protein n=1 Tax=Planobispora rosea TaxID=35762 RepID=UPI00159EFF34|nr:hypothetical protein [Planobispora rosea]